MDRPIKPAVNLCFEISHWEESFGVWAVVEIWSGRIQVESQDEVVIGGGDDTDGIEVRQRQACRPKKLIDGHYKWRNQGNCAGLVRKKQR